MPDQDVVATTRPEDRADDPDAAAGRSPRGMRRQVAGTTAALVGVALLLVVAWVPFGPDEADSVPRAGAKWLAVATAALFVTVGVRRFNSTAADAVAQRPWVTRAYLAVAFLAPGGATTYAGDDPPRRYAGGFVGFAAPL